MPISNEPRSPERIREDLDRTRAATQESLERVHRELQAVTDWREWVRRHPWTCLSVAAALGLGFGLARRHRGGPHGNAD